MNDVKIDDHGGEDADPRELLIAPQDWIHTVFVGAGKGNDTGDYEWWHAMCDGTVSFLQMCILLQGVQRSSSSMPAWEFLFILKTRHWGCGILIIFVTFSYKEQKLQLV